MDILAVLIVYGLIGLAMIIGSFLLKHNSKADARRVLHVVVGNFIFIWWLFSDRWAMEIFFVIPFIALLLYIMLRKDIVSNSLISKAMVNGNNTGLLFYAISIGILVTLAFDHFVAASVGVAAMTYGDSMGRIVGKRFGKHKIINGKSLEGSFGVFAMSTVIALVVILFYTFLISNGYYSLSTADAILPIWLICPIVGLAAAVLEAVVPGDFDNLSLPLGITAILILLGM